MRKLLEKKETDEAKAIHKEIQRARTKEEKEVKRLEKNLLSNPPNVFLNMENFRKVPEVQGCHNGALSIGVGNL